MLVTKFVQSSRKHVSLIHLFIYKLQQYDTHCLWLNPPDNSQLLIGCWNELHAAINYEFCWHALIGLINNASCSFIFSPV